MKDDLLRPGERVDDLQRGGFHLIQNPSAFCFGIDAVLLAFFAKVMPGEDVLDMCTGNGAVMMLLAARQKGRHLTGLEIQKEAADLARRNVVLNHAEDTCDVVEGDLKCATDIFGYEKFNVITVNPPYMKAQTGFTNPNSAKAIARHEILCTSEDVIRSCSKLLKVRGRLYMVHRPQRLVELFEQMRAYKLEPKRIRMIHPNKEKNANMVLIEAVKGGNAELITEPPLFVYESDGTYTKELRDVY